MQRLISLFKRPEDFEPLDEPRRRELLSSSAELKGLLGGDSDGDEPEYFVQLMTFLRDRNGAGAARFRDEARQEALAHCGAD